MIADARNFVESSFAAITPLQVGQAYKDLAAAFGFSVTLIVDTSKLQAAIGSALIFATNTGEVEKRDRTAPFLTNPVCRLALEFDAPFALDEAVGVTGLRETDLRVLMPEHVRDMEIISLPVHRNGELAYYVACCGTRPDDTPLVRATLHTCAHAVYDRINALEGGTSLTPRQADCLYWISRGKSYSETGQILELSARTVRAEIAKAKRILGARTKAEAIAKAARLNAS